MICDVLIPTVGRADRLAGLIENIVETSPEGVMPILILDTDDHDSFEAAMMREADVAIVRADGSYPHKTNVGFTTGAKIRTSDYVLPTADDVVFYKGWWEPVIAAFGDLGVQVVGTNDLSPMSNDEHSTMPVIRRRYCNDPGCSWQEPRRVFHPGYHHNFVESEICELARRRTCWRYEPEAVIEHLHPVWHKREADATDAIGNQRHFDEDALLFTARQREWEAPDAFHGAADPR